MQACNVGLLLRCSSTCFLFLPLFPRWFFRFFWSSSRISRCKISSHIPGFNTSNVWLLRSGSRLLRCEFFITPLSIRSRLALVLGSVIFTQSKDFGNKYEFTCKWIELLLLNSRLISIMQNLTLSLRLACCFLKRAILAFCFLMSLSVKSRGFSKENWSEDGAVSLVKASNLASSKRRAKDPSGQAKLSTATLAVSRTGGS